jgi:hypothetical protein
VKVRTLAAAAAVTLAMSISGGAAQAATYMLTVDGCSAGCLGSNTQLGMVTVTQDASLSGVLDFSVVLDNGALFNVAGGGNQHHALVFDLNGGGASLAGLTYSNFTNINSSNQVVSTTDFAGATGGPFSDSPFGSTWTNAVNYVGSLQGNSAANPSNFSFQLSDTLNNLSLSMLHYGDVNNGHQVMVASDVYANSTTGNVGGLAGGVPEPATWGLMITGVFFVGAAMRRQRRRALASA